MSGVLLDTRTPYRSDQTHLGTEVPESLVGSAGLLLFRRQVQHLLGCPHRERAEARAKVISRLQSTRDPVAYINELLDNFVTGGGPDGLDIAIDTLAKVGGRVIEYSREFRQQDSKRWKTAAMPGHHMNDDVWYVLLRAVAVSDLSLSKKIPMILSCAMDGTPSIREGAVRALGDLGVPPLRPFLARIAATDPDPLVRDTATEVLSDLEG